MKQMKELRALRGLSLHALADLSGVDYSSLSRIENGKRKPSVYAARDIAAALGVSLDVLVGDHTDDVGTSEKRRGKVPA